MSNLHPYAATLAARAERNKNLSTRVPFRKLLGGFGYKRRTERALAEITEALESCGLRTEISPVTDLDETIVLTLATSPSPPTAPDPIWSSGQGDLADIAEKALQATVAIFTEDGLGAGFIIHPDGLVVTGRHVIDENRYSLRQVKVGLVDDRLFDGFVFCSHRQLDFALIWLLADGPFPTIPIADPQKIRPAQTALAIGSPNGLHKTVSRGIISNPRQRINGIEWIQTDTAIYHGNSGGPLLTQHGVIGINLWGHAEAANARFALPLDYLRVDLDLALKNGRDKCLNARYCPGCGFTDYKKPVWYCRNCGVQFVTETEPQG
ncbi:MAG: trypsin-like peptidase domain-containing protein [Anaerolineae bacterium]|nr:trypsin-like peptidase domain-containing protein [Anaerolineae bacterium]